MIDIGSTIENAVRYAEAQIGKPYSQPKRTLSGWYDCSSLVARAFISAGYTWGTDGAPVPRSLYEPYEDGFELIWPAEYDQIGDTLPTASTLLGQIKPQRGDLMFVAFPTSKRFNRIEHVTMLTSGTRIVHARGVKWGVRADPASLYGRKVAAVTRFNPLCDLRNGHKGNRVKALQRALNERAMSWLTVDGDFGALTEADVRAFQAYAQLPVTGRGDAATRAALGMTDEYVPARPTLKLGDKGEAVREMQQRLQMHGYELEADADFGPLTDKAVRAFQKAHGLTADGQCGPITFDALLEDTGELPGPTDGAPAPVYTYTLTTPDFELVKTLYDQYGGAFTPF